MLRVEPLYGLRVPTEGFISMSTWYALVSVRSTSPSTGIVRGEIVGREERHHWPDYGVYRAGDER